MIMDVGCGDGGLLPKLARFGHVSGVEPNASVLHDDAPFRDHIFTHPLGHESYRHMRFDVVTALDVLGHTADDHGAVADMAAMVRAGGHLVMTVPASVTPWAQEGCNGTNGRCYSASALGALLGPHGRLVAMRYLFHSLFVQQLISGRSGVAHDVTASAVPRPWLNRMMTGACNLEHRVTHWLPLPFGTYLLAVIERPATEPIDEPILAPQFGAAVPAA